MKLTQLQSRLWLWIGALALGALWMVPASARGTASVIFTISSTTLATTGLTTINIDAAASTGTLGGSGFSLYIQVGDGGPWLQPNDPVQNGTSPNASTDATGPVMNFSPAGGSTTPTGGLFNGDTKSASGNNAYTVDDQYGTTDPPQSQLYYLTGSFSTSKTLTTTPILLATLALDTSNLPAGVYGQTYSIVLFGSSGNSSFGSGGNNTGPGKTGQALPSEVLPATSTPEPASIGLLGVLLPGLLLRRRRKAA